MSSFSYSFNLILHQYAKKGDVNNVERILNVMKTHHIPLTSYSYTAWMEVYCQMAQENDTLTIGDTVEKIFQHMKDNPECKESTIHYNYLLRAWSLSNNAKRADAIFKQMI